MDGCAERNRFRDLALVLLVAWGARAGFILLMPSVFSDDVRHWEAVTHALDLGQNPYRVTSYLNWPPLWMQVSWAIGRLSRATQLSFPRILQFVLMLTESAAVVAQFRLLKLLAPAADLRAILLIGISLNPIAILLICQHGSFDVLVGLWVVLFLTRLVIFYRDGDAMDWLAACLFLGLAVLTKTVPLVLAPLLVQSAHRLGRKALWLGALLVLGPAVLAVSVIFVLAPRDVTHNVIAYRSIGGYFGISGLAAVLGVSKAGELWASAFPWGLLGTLMWIGRRLWQRADLPGKDLVLLAATLLLAVPTLGPGYAPQYIYWSLPLLVASVVCYVGAWRKLIVGVYAIAALTYVVEYALFSSHGMFLVRLLPGDARVVRWAEEWSTPHGQTLVRLPLFLAFLATMIGSASLLRRSLSRSREASLPAAISRE